MAQKLHLTSTAYGHKKMPTWQVVLFLLAIIILASITCPIAMVAMGAG